MNANKGPEVSVDQQCVHLGYCPYKDMRKLPTTAQLARQTLAIVLAGGRGERLGPLTEWRAKPAVPFGGKFRIIDFTLSNCVNSGIRRIGICTQYRAQSLIRHLQRGWAFLDGRFHEFVELLPAQQRVSSAWYQGTADAVYQNLDFLRYHDPAFVLVLAGDHVYKMDFGRMLEEHVSRGARMSVGCVEAPLADATQLGVMQVDAAFRITGFQEKPSRPAPMPGRDDVALSSMGIYLFDAKFLYEQLHSDAGDASSSRDFGKDIIPRLVRDGVPVFAHRFADSCVNMSDGRPYWRDVGTVDAYWQANMELTRVTPDLNLYDETWPVWTYQPQLPPGKFVFDTDGRRGAAVDSLVSGGCVVSGSDVRRSVLFSGVRVNSYSSIEDSLILPYADVARHAVLRRVVLDSRCRVPEGMQIGVDPETDRRRFHVTPGGVTLVTPEMLGQHIHHHA